MNYDFVKSDIYYTSLEKIRLDVQFVQEMNLSPIILPDSIIKSQFTLENPNTKQTKPKENEDEKDLILLPK
jgi:hypothetical protein